jgi:hypothetical protein
MKNAIFFLSFFFFVISAQAQVEIKASPLRFSGNKTVGLEISLSDQWSLEGYTEIYLSDFRSFNFFRKFDERPFYHLAARYYPSAVTDKSRLYVGPYARLENDITVATDPELVTKDRFSLGAQFGYKVLLGKRFNIDLNAASPLYKEGLKNPSPFWILRRTTLQCTIGYRF